MNIHVTEECRQGFGVKEKKPRIGEAFGGGVEYGTVPGVVGKSVEPPLIGSRPSRPLGGRVCSSLGAKSSRDFFP